mmetsp:Transcript_9865/g.23274  ORF Transcript_9865/g.23274 Transcript_9865/m.23274 type:complete len:205 (+) Transcript_9865:4052-4666(+)
MSLHAFAGGFFTFVSNKFNKSERLESFTFGFRKRRLSVGEKALNGWRHCPMQQCFKGPTQVPLPMYCCRSSSSTGIHEILVVRLSVVVVGSSPSSALYRSSSVSIVVVDTNEKLLFVSLLFNTRGPPFRTEVSSGSSCSSSPKVLIIIVWLFFKVFSSDFSCSTARFWSYQSISKSRNPQTITKEANANCCMFVPWLLHGRIWR